MQNAIENMDRKTKDLNSTDKMTQIRTFRIDFLSYDSNPNQALIVEKYVRALDYIFAKTINFFQANKYSMYNIIFGQSYNVQVANWLRDIDNKFVNNCAMFRKKVLTTLTFSDVGKKPHVERFFKQIVFDISQKWPFKDKDFESSDFFKNQVDTNLTAESCDDMVSYFDIFFYG
jgi:hypothetical protein